MDSLFAPNTEYAALVSLRAVGEEEGRVPPGTSKELPSPGNRTGSRQVVKRQVPLA